MSVLINKRFNEYVRSTAFSINLSSSQIRHLHWQMYQDETGDQLPGFAWNMGTLQALLKKGILGWDHERKWFVTEEGGMVHKLLGAAGYFDDGKSKNGENHDCADE